MSRHEATRRAKKTAIRTQAWTYVVWSQEEDGDYHDAREWELDTFYAGAAIVLAIGPDGTVEG